MTASIPPPPLADLARAVAQALERFADNLEHPQGNGNPVPLGDRQAAGEVTVEPSKRAENAVRGPRQREIVALPGLSEEGGMKTADIAAAVGMEVANAYLTLRGLEAARVVEMVPDKQPQHWRLVRRYRATASPYLRIASQVREGEWTTYGDVSIGVRGDTKAAVAVDRAAATLSSFPSPHRVISPGGLIPDAWHDRDGNGPTECRRRLEEEGVRFGDDGRADPTQRVSWDVLLERAEAGQASADDGAR